MPVRPCGWSFAVLAVAWLLSIPQRTAADDMSPDKALWRVEFSVSPEQDPRELEGRILVEAQDGGILIEDRSGVLWNVTPEQIVRRELAAGDYSRLSAPELAEELRAALGGTVHIVTTDHYVIATAGSRWHAEWCGHLLERLLKAFLGYWRSPELDLQSPRSPLPVIIYQDRATFGNAAVKEAGVAFAEANGYYSMRTNRVSLFDHVHESLKSTNSTRPIRSRADVQRLLSQDPAPVSTIVHEATHQMAFNSGMHTRYADNPIWLTEGMAMYCELPDLSGSAGWRTIGRLNSPRLRVYRESLASKETPESLTSLTGDDARFQNPETMEVAYAEAWMFTHFLVHSHRREYSKYLRMCSERTPLDWKTREERLREFEEAFGMRPLEFQDRIRLYAEKLGRR